MTAGGWAPARFIGRERELEAVLDAAAEAGTGRTGTVLLEASSGIGASRLISEAVARLTAAGGGPSDLAVLRAGGLPAWRGAPYAPFRSALEHFLAEREPGGAARLLGSGAELLLPLLPGVAAQFPGAPTNAVRRERLPERIREAFRGVLGRLAAEGPVLLVVEDLHVLDAASRSLLAFLARTLGSRPISIVGSYQPDALGRGHPLRETLDAIDAGPRPARRVSLPPLDRATLRDLIAAHEGDAPSAPVLLLVAERSGGNPLVAEEVLAARRELTGASLTVPLEQLVVARAARRSPECRRILRILAVADGPLLPAQLGAVAAAYDAEVGRQAPRSAASRQGRAGGLDPDLAAGVAEAVQHGFVEAVAGAAGASDSTARPLRIRHELLAGALDADLLPGSRRRMHASVASVLLTHAAEAGRHWHRAHEAGRELLAEIEAASEAERMGAAADALVHLELAIELAGAPAAAGAVDAAGELDLALRAAEASNGAGDAGRAVAFVASAIARHPHPQDRAARAELTERLGAFRAAGGDRNGALVAYERALELLPATPTVARCRVLATTAQLRMLEGSFSDAERLASEAIDVGRRAGPEGRGWVGHAACTLGVVDGLAGRPELAIDRLEEALAVAIELGRLDDAFRSRANLTTVLDLEGRREEALEVALRGIAAAEIDGLEVVHGNLLRGNATDFLVSLGRWREARTLAERALDWAPFGIPFVNAALGLAFVEAETNAGDAAARLLGRMFLELETVPDIQFAVPAYQAAASLALWRGDLADATRAVDEAWSRVRTSEYWALAARTAATALTVADARGRAAHERRDLATLAAVRSWSDQVLGQASRMVETAGAPAETWVRLEVEADLATARAYAARLRSSDTPEMWAHVADRWRSLRRPYDEARALHRQVEAILEAGAHAGAHAGARREGRDDARGPLEAAATIAVALGAIPLLRALADLAGRARIVLPTAARDALAAADAKPAPPAPSLPDRRERPARDRGEVRSEVRTAASFGLSAREQGVLAEIAAGRTNREIGERLFISDKTVGVHVGNILVKLGVGGRVEAAMVAVRLALVDDLVERAKKPGPRGPGFGDRRRGGAA